MTRTRTIALLACLLFAAGTSAQLHETPDPGTGGGGGCKNWMCYDLYSPVQCWSIGEPTGIRASECSVLCDLGYCWCAMRGHCYSI